MTLNPKKSADRYVILVICRIGQQNVTGRSNVDVSSCGAVLLNANYVPKSIPSQLVDEKRIDNVLVLNSTYSSACTVCVIALRQNIKPFFYNSDV